MALRMAKRYQDLGGKIHLNTPVEKVIVNGKKAEGIVIASKGKAEEDLQKKIVKADYVICASDANHTFTKLLDVWTPVTYNRYCNSFHGAYMGFIVSKNAKNKTVAGKIKGLSNVFIASQWLMGPGGLPTAAAMGKFAAQRIVQAKRKIGNP